MTRSAMFESPEARARIAGWYDRFAAKLPRNTQSRILKTRAGETHVLSLGPEDAPPLVCLHGALASSAHLMNELLNLSERYRLHCVDVLGQSVKSEDARVPLDGSAYGDWVADVMDGLALPKASLLGVSWGGFVVLRAAIAHPSRVERLVLLVPAGVVAGPAWKGFWEMGLPIMMYRMFPSEARLRKVTAGLFTSHDDQWMTYFGDAIRSYRLDVRIPPLAKPDETRAIESPVLVVGASDDVSFPGASLLARAKELLPHAETELLEGAKHSPSFDETFRKWLADRIHRFLSRSAAPVLPIEVGAERVEALLEEGGELVGPAHDVLQRLRS